MSLNFPKECRINFSLDEISDINFLIKNKITLREYSVYYLYYYHCFVDGAIPSSEYYIIENTLKKYYNQCLKNFKNKNIIIKHCI